MFPTEESISFQEEVIFGIRWVKKVDIPSHPAGESAAFLESYLKSLHYLFIIEAWENYSDFKKWKFLRVYICTIRGFQGHRIPETSGISLHEIAGE